MISRKILAQFLFVYQGLNQPDNLVSSWRGGIPDLSLIPMCLDPLVSNLDTHWINPGALKDIEAKAFVNFVISPDDFNVHPG